MSCHRYHQSASHGWAYNHAQPLPPSPPSESASCSNRLRCDEDCKRISSCENYHCGRKKQTRGASTSSAGCHCCRSSISSSSCCCSTSSSSSSSSSSNCHCCKSSTSSSVSAPTRLWHEFDEPPELVFDPTATELIEGRPASLRSLKRKSKKSKNREQSSRGEKDSTRKIAIYEDICCKNPSCFGNTTKAISIANVVSLYLKKKAYSCESANESALQLIARNFKEASNTDAFLLLGLDDAMYLARSKYVICTEIMMVEALLRFASAQKLRRHEIRNLLEVVQFGLIPDECVAGLAKSSVASKISSFPRLLHSRFEAREILRPKHTGVEALRRNNIQARAVFNLTPLIREQARIDGALSAAAWHPRRGGISVRSSQNNETGPLVREFAFIAKGYAWGMLVEMEDRQLRAYLRCIRGDGEMGSKHHRASHKVTQLITTYRFRLHQSSGEKLGMVVVGIGSTLETDMMKSNEDQSSDWAGPDESLVTPKELSALVAAGRPLEISVDLISVKRKT